MVMHQFFLVWTLSFIVNLYKANPTNPRVMSACPARPIVQHSIPVTWPARPIVLHIIPVTCPALPCPPGSQWAAAGVTLSSRSSCGVAGASITPCVTYHMWGHHEGSQELL